ncbi:aspartyl-phosphate phosphatase Spo0E family protein (plasmid) [Pseudalkalibacillus hwajinpoensis]|uniref:aspartyl-phosphate phosphatase Spo0E family protein n=1 Tax=Guptibacillus hwajinpoensis TaxID=208199 RepID=UPI00325A9BAF
MLKIKKKFTKNELIVEIERLRGEMVRTAKNRGLSSKDVLIVSQELDVFLNLLQNQMRG